MENKKPQNPFFKRVIKERNRKYFQYDHDTSTKIFFFFDCFISLLGFAGKYYIIYETVSVKCTYLLRSTDYNSNSRVGRRSGSPPHC